MVPWITKAQMIRYLSGSIFTTLWLKDNEKIYLGTGKDVEIYYDGTDFQIKPAVVGSGKLDVGGHMSLPADNRKIYLGASDEAEIYHDGSDLSFKDGTTSVKTLAELAAGGGAATTGAICLHPNAAILNATDGATRVQVDGTNHAYEVCDFPTASVTKADWHFTVPRDYDGGNVTVNIVWIATATTNGVVFDANYLSVGDSAQYDAALTNVACAAVTVDGTQWDTNLSTCTLTTPFTAGQTAILRIHRETGDGSDTMAADARVIMVELQYTRSSA